MPPHSPVGAEQARLYAEALRLSEEFHARLAAGEEVDGDRFIRRRQEILARVESAGAANSVASEAGPERERHVRESTEALRRMRELDRRIVELLQARMAGIGRELTAISRGRRSLSSYRGPAAVTPAFLDRRG